ncbi:hypothetical protein FA15DRAFT_688909 [Coprinopsis marcescibilis]|uniref:Mid2 domain-containing protein n=1 Tax=Coprinopsis marcescibilis TaxID=230819 RepID=A0A5C3KL74_COPMA|nr:hypothetical protein FA15DRAFT_688909 [Coprinopsis marcescibilis]
MGVLIFDDADPAITYSTGDWDRAGSDREFNSTTTWTTEEGATATIQFIGTRISVHGTIGAGRATTGARSAYVVDDDTPVIFEATPDTTVQYNQLFFQSPELEEGQHTLTITNVGDEDRDQFFIDLLIVAPLETPMVTTVTSTLTRSAAPVAASTVTVTSLVAQTSPVSAGGAQEGNGAVRSETGNPAAIAGGVIGGILALLLIVAGIFFYKKRTSKKKNTDDSYWVSPSSHVQPALTPFPPPTPASPQMAQSTYGGYSTRQGYPNQAPSQYPSSPPVPLDSELAYYTQNDYQQPSQYRNGNYPSPNMGQPAGRIRVNLNDPSY